MVRGFWAGGALWRASADGQVSAVLADGTAAEAWREGDGVGWTAGKVRGHISGCGLLALCGHVARETRRAVEGRAA